MALPETTKEWIERYEKRERRAYDNYQQTGEQKYDRQQYEYSKIVDAFRALERSENEYHDNIKKRQTNYEFVADKLFKSEYSREEVLELLRQAIYW